MLRFLCIICGKDWYSSADYGHKCGDCGGKLEEDKDWDGKYTGPKRKDEK